MQSERAPAALKSPAIVSILHNHAALVGRSFCWTRSSQALQLPTVEETAHGGSRSAAKDKMSGKQKLCVSFTTLTNSNTTEQRQGLILTRSGPDQQTSDLLEEIRTDRLIYIIIFPMHTV